MKSNFVMLAFLLAFSLKAQTITVLHIDTKGLGYSPAQMGDLLRIELDKLQKYQVTDRYDVAYLIKEKKLTVDSCYGKICLVEIGKAIKSDKMLGGTVERLGKKIIVSLRLIDVNSETVEKSYIREFLDFPSEIQVIMAISLREMFGLTNDTAIVKKLTETESYEGILNNPYASRLKLSGPRMGVTYFTGDLAERLAEGKQQGGFDAMPLMFQFGYQLETQYLNEGNYQGLFEFIPMLTGFDQGLIIPSFTLLNGLRNNKTGWEIAFGPTFSLVKAGEGYYDASGNWQLLGEQDRTQVLFPIEKRLDSRGNLDEVRVGFLIAAGKTLRSGKLNIPLNIYCIPSKEGLRFGASFGFNGKNRRN
ncbi:MAG: hypothetical protein SFU27_07220 [Thermonemataceae bacterium]|nr:hypothetical protein [Thermonemataceae bacterium]